VDILGALYFPLIYVDQKLLHRSRPYLTFTDADIEKGHMYGWPPVE
jgi:hypothetical protein